TALIWRSADPFAILPAPLASTAAQLNERVANPRRRLPALTHRNLCQMPFLIRSQTLRRKNRDAWQQVGLVAGFLAGRHFVGATDLHYGYWSDGVDHTIRNMPRAQEDYCSFLLEHIPPGLNRILDVGCGAGGVASRLIERGHHVDCVSPSPFLNQQARTLLGDRARIFECKYEDFNT